MRKVFVSIFIYCFCTHIFANTSGNNYLASLSELKNAFSVSTNTSLFNSNDMMMGYAGGDLTKQILTPVNLMA